MTYTYNPSESQDRGKDQMRFELGDTDMSQVGATCALSDEEYLAVLAGIGTGKTAWLQGKLTLVEGILHKLAFQVDTKIDVMEYHFSQRVTHWETLHQQLKKELQSTQGVPILTGTSSRNPPYFYGGIHDNRR